MPSTAAPLLENGIEVACADERFDRWLERRRAHYSVVVVSRASNIERFDHFLRKTQPQARRIYDIEALARRFEQEGAESAQQLRELDEKGIEGADVILCVSDEEAAARAARMPRLRPADVRVAAEAGSAFDERSGVVFFGGSSPGPVARTRMPRSGSSKT